MNYYEIAGHDDWKCTDTEGDLAWDEIFLQEWTESLIRMEHQYMDDEDVAILAEERQRTGYYDNVEF